LSICRQCSTCWRGHLTGRWQWARWFPADQMPGERLLDQIKTAKAPPMSHSQWGERASPLANVEGTAPGSAAAAAVRS